MCRQFNVHLTGERNPVFIVADTREDAQAQAMEIAKHAGKMVVSVFEINTPPPSFEQNFNRILG